MYIWVWSIHAIQSIMTRLIWRLSSSSDASSSDAIEQHDLIPYLYADDTQICGYSPPSDVLQLQERISGCVDDVAKWMQSNRLQLNTAKTEVLWCASIWRQHQIPQPGLRVGVDVIVPSASVRDLGIYLDCDVSMRTQWLMSPRLCPAVSRCCGDSAAFVRRLRGQSLCRSSCHWFCLALTTAMPHSPA